MKELRGRNSSNNLKKLKKKEVPIEELTFKVELRWSTTQRLTPTADGSELPEWDQSKQLSTVVNICLGNGYRPRPLVCLLVFTTTDCFTISGLVLRIFSLMNIYIHTHTHTHMCVCGWVVRLERNSFINALPGWAHPKPPLRNTDGQKLFYPTLPYCCQNTLVGQGMAQWNTDSHCPTEGGWL